MLIKQKHRSLIIEQRKVRNGRETINISIHENGEHQNINGKKIRICLNSGYSRLFYSDTCKVYLGVAVEVNISE